MYWDANVLFKKQQNQLKIKFFYTRLRKNKTSKSLNVFDECANLCVNKQCVFTFPLTFCFKPNE